MPSLRQMQFTSPIIIIIIITTTDYGYARLKQIMGNVAFNL